MSRSRRSYRLGKRESAIAERRQKIVAAARELLLEGGFYRMRMEDVAKRSGVTRATVFNQFGSKLALLQAIAAEAGQRSRSQTTFEAQKLPDAYEAFRLSLIEGYRFFAAERMMFRQIISLAAVDPEAKELVAGFEQNRRQGMKQMADRLADEGYMREGWSRGTLADLLWIATSFETFDLLHSGRGLSARVAAQRTLAMAGAGLKRG
jgi:AcrR family transcriptional regulator